MYPTVAELLPPWLRVVWAVLLVVALVVEAVHAARSAGPRRWWHAAYAAIALGLIVMYALNPLTSSGLEGAGLIVFVAALVGVLALIGATLADRRHHPSATPLWVIAIVDMLALAYVQIPATVRPVPLCVLVAAYLAVMVVLRLVVAVRGRGRPSARFVDPAVLGEVEHEQTGGGTGVLTRTGTTTSALVAVAVVALSMIYVLSV